MHWSGKLFIWMALLAWLAALPLVTKLLTIRNKWQADLAAVRIQNEKNAEELKVLRAERSDLQTGYATTTRGWGQTWTDHALGNVNVQTGEMEIQLGSDDGLGLPDINLRPIVIHGFHPVGDEGQYEYMGPFRVKTLGNINSTVEPLWKVVDGEIAAFDLKPNVTLLRWREYVPTSATVAFNEFHKQLVYHGEQLDKRKRDLEREEASLLKHREQLQERMNELVGVPGGDPGLLEEIVTAEAERNARLAEVDALRRRIAEAYDRQQALQASVEDLESRLPGGTN